MRRRTACINRMGHRAERLIIVIVSVIASALCGGLLAASGSGAAAVLGSWQLSGGNLAGTRAADGSALRADNVSRLEVRWRFRLKDAPISAGIFASTPVVDGDTIYIEDLRSTVFALDRDTRAVRWTKRFAAPNGGPNGLAVSGGRVYGATDSDAFALSAATGEELWQRHLTSQTQQFVDVAPVVWKGLVFLGTVGYAPLGRGAIDALDARTGALRWRFVTIRHRWRHPWQAGGGGIWYPVSVDARGRLYAGIANPGPWGGSRQLPNGAAFPGPALYTDSLLVLGARSGRLLWYDQVTPHDVRDYDFEATPILASLDGTGFVFGAGKAGRVIAWNRDTRKRVWNAVAGLHRNDTGPLPRRRVTVCPGLLGGVETAMAYAAGRLFVPVVDLCGWGSASGRQSLATVDPARGRGELVALDAKTGRRLWDRRLPSPDFGCATVANDVVFTSTYAGVVYALAARDGRILWRAKMPAGVNACPAVAGDLLLLGAGVPRSHASRPALVAFGPR
jgi:alcohol dehydrogenase (cytochrome c)